MHLQPTCVAATVRRCSATPRLVPRPQGTLPTRAAPTVHGGLRAERPKLGGLTPPATRSDREPLRCDVRIGDRATLEKRLGCTTLPAMVVRQCYFLILAAADQCCTVAAAYAACLEALAPVTRNGVDAACLRPLFAQVMAVFTDVEAQQSAAMAYFDAHLPG